MKKNIKKRIVIIGDDDTGKTTAVKTFVEQIKLRSSENNLDVQSLENNDDRPNTTEQNNNTTNNNTNINNNVNDKKDDTDSSDSSYSTDEGNQKIRAEITSKLILATLTVDNLTYDLEILDTGDDNDFKENRKYIYKKANMVLLFFAINSKSSFESITNKWKSELKKMNKKAPFILVGNKMDLRTEAAVTPEEGRDLALKLGARKYLECSTITAEGLKELFIEAVKSNQKKSCSIS